MVARILTCRRCGNEYMGKHTCPPTTPAVGLDRSVHLRPWHEAVAELVAAMGEDITAGYDESDRTFSARAKLIGMLDAR